MLHLSAEDQETSQHILFTKLICIFTQWLQRFQGKLLCVASTHVYLTVAPACSLISICYSTTEDEPKASVSSSRFFLLSQTKKREMKIMQEHDLELKAGEYSQTSQQGTENGSWKVVRNSTVSLSLSLSLSLTLILLSYPSFPTFLLFSLPHTLSEARWAFISASTCPLYSH